MDATTTEQLMAELRAVARDAEELLQATADQTGIDEQVRKNPWAAVAIAAGVGLVIGLLLSRK